MEIKNAYNNVLNYSIGCVVNNYVVWFRGKDVARALGYENTTQAIQINVDDDDKHK